MANVSVLGLGAMGSRMAASLLEAGHDVTVWNRNPERTHPLAEKGAIAAATPSEAVKNADFAVAMVRDVEASRHVWLDPNTGALAALPRDAVAIESSTITVAWARELAAHFEQKKVAFVEAPVSGSRKQADAKELIYLVGGEEKSVDRARPILLNMGTSVQHMGPAGAGTAIKLMINSALAAQLASVVELLSMTTQLGVDRQTAMDVFNATSIASPWIKNNTAALLAADFSPQFTVDLIEKDLSYTLAAAKSVDSSAPVTQQVQQVFATAIRKGYGEENMTAIASLYSSAK